MVRSALWWMGLLLLPVGAGCSAIVDPDETALAGGGGGGGVDSGPGGGDAGPGADGGPGSDAGPGVDSGPGVDAGPGSCDGPARCEGGTLILCEAGVERRVECPMGCAASGDGCEVFLPSNVSPDLWRGDAADVSLVGGREYLLDTSECSPTMATGMIVPQTDGPELCVLSVGAFAIGGGASLTVRGSRPLVIMATGDVTIDGTLDLSARGDVPGPGGFRGGWRDEIDGGGVGGGFGGAHEGAFDDGGGGGGGLCGAGGDGGRGGGAAGGAGGGAVSGGWELSPLHGGSGGGRGRGRFLASGATNAGLGGAGAGALQISSLGTIRIGPPGVILGGGGGGLPGANRIGDANWGSGGGGGSGGAVLLEAPSVSIQGHVNVAGGGGGGGAGGAADGLAGEDGAPALERRAEGGAGGDTFRGADGGDSGGGTDAGALDGVDNTAGNANGGGGGGGGGCVLVRTRDGTVAGMPKINPSVDPSWRVGSLRGG